MKTKRAASSCGAALPLLGKRELAEEGMKLLKFASAADQTHDIVFV